MLSDSRVKVRIYDIPNKLGKNVFIFWQHHDKIEILQPNDIIKTIPRGETIDTPTFYLPEDTLIPLMEALAKMGVRADIEAKNEGELVATKYHLEDLRKLVLKKDGKAKA